VAVTLKVAVRPTVTVWFCGWAVMDGEPAAEVTVSVATVLVTVLIELATSTENVESLLERVVAGVV
jgi:hypothetical protein